MKTKSMILALFLSIISVYSFGQRLNFQNKTLLILQTLPYTTTYETIIQQLESSNIKVNTSTNKDKTQNLSFSLGEKTHINIRYTKDKKFIYAYTYTEEPRYEAPAGFKRAEDQLKNQQFKEVQEKITNENVFGPYIYTYSKADYPYEYIIYNYSESDELKIYIYDKSFGSFDKYKNEY